MDHRDRAPPVALPGNQPVPQPELHLALTPALRFGGGTNGPFGFAAGQPIKPTGVDQHARLGPGFPLVGVFITAFRDHHLAKRQFVLAGKQKIALVMGGHTHHGPRAVIGQDVIRDPDRNQLPGGGVAHLRSQGHTPFGAVVGGALLLALATDQITEGLHCHLLSGVGEVAHQVVLRGQDHIGGAKDGVGSGGENGDQHVGGSPCPIHHRKTKLGAGGTANPVGLHGAHALWPTREFGQVFQQGIGIGRDLQEPLAQLALFHQGP